MPKNIVICCDGTNNAIAGDQTNVLRLFRMLVRDAGQVVFYDSGVGSKADPTALWPWRRFLRKKFDQGVGSSIRANVLDAYDFLARHYAPGDSVYLFGFSRGAYTVRALSGMLKRCGLLFPDFMHLAEYAWAIFSDEDQQHDASITFGGAARIKKVFAREIDVHFLGVWDTVSSFGWFWDQLTLPNTTNNDLFHHVRHALSIDERRSFFRASLLGSNNGPDCIEVWFPGGHADIGGGYDKKEAGLARLTLAWMLSEAKKYDLRTDQALEEDLLQDIGNRKDPSELAVQHDESRRISWRLLGWLPRRAFTESKVRRWCWPNFAKRRIIPEGASIHFSVLVRMSDKELKYKPTLPSQFTVVGMPERTTADAEKPFPP